jgi:hypothetical protein
VSGTDPGRYSAGAPTFVDSTRNSSSRGPRRQNRVVSAGTRPHRGVPAPVMACSAVGCGCPRHADDTPASARPVNPSTDDSMTVPPRAPCSTSRMSPTRYCRCSSTPPLLPRTAEDPATVSRSRGLYL